MYVERKKRYYSRLLSSAGILILAGAIYGIGHHYGYANGYNDSINDSAIESGNVHYALQSLELRLNSAVAQRADTVAQIIDDVNAENTIRDKNNDGFIDTCEILGRKSCGSKGIKVLKDRIKTGL
ncbi:MAG: hypothetical protein AABX19_00765 [Nanoarchaeota archaeon]